MNCQDAHIAMHGYVDGELDPTTTLRYEQHVRACADCARMLAEQKALQRGMQADGLYYRAPDALRKRVRSTIRKQAVGRGTRPARWAAAAACVVFCVGLGYVLAQFAVAPSKHERLAWEIASSHIRSLQVDKSRLVDVRSTDRHEVKPWFNDKLDFAPRVLDLAKEGFPLVGGRLDYVDGRAVAALVYTRRKHVINVFLWPDAANEETAPRRESRQGYHLIHWSTAGMTYWVVSDLEPAELNELVQRLRA